MGYTCKQEHIITISATESHKATLPDVLEAIETAASLCMTDLDYNIVKIGDKVTLKPRRKRGGKE